MATLSELYQGVIIEHDRSPRNFRTLAAPTHHAEGRNPLCGDEVAVELKVQRDAIEDVRFTATGCAVSRAAASIMTQAVKGKSRAEVDQLLPSSTSSSRGSSSPRRRKRERWARWPRSAVCRDSPCV